MNANQNQNQQDQKINFDLISLEKIQPLSIWKRLKMAFESSDLNFQEWQRLESKKTPSSSSPMNWRNH